MENRCTVANPSSIMYLIKYECSGFMHEEWCEFQWYINWLVVYLIFDELEQADYRYSRQHVGLYKTVKFLLFFQP
jgi:hypothetical protein